MRTVCVRIKKEKWGSHDAPCPGFLDLQGANMDTLVWIIMYYNVPNNIDSLLKKRHPNAGENRARQGCRTRFSAQWTAAGIAKCSNEIGFDDFTKPDLSSDDLPATLPKSSARRRHWGQGFPLQGRFDIKTRCLRETPALKGRRFTAARGGEALRSGA